MDTNALQVMLLVFTNWITIPDQTFTAQIRLVPSMTRMYSPQAPPELPVMPSRGGHLVSAGNNVMNLNEATWEIGQLKGRMTAIEENNKMAIEDRRQILQKTESIETKLDARLKPLEKGYWRATGFVACIGAIASFAAVIVAKLLKL